LGEAEDAVVSLDGASPSVVFPTVAAAAGGGGRASLANLVALLLSSEASKLAIAVCVSTTLLDILLK
jgi:hypothetical protein